MTFLLLLKDKEEDRPAVPPPPTPVPFRVGHTERETLVNLHTYAVHAVSHLTLIHDHINGSAGHEVVKRKYEYLAGIAEFIAQPAAGIYLDNEFLTHLFQCLSCLLPKQPFAAKGSMQKREAIFKRLTFGTPDLKSAAATDKNPDLPRNKVMYDLVMNVSNAAMKSVSIPTVEKHFSKGMIMQLVRLLQTEDPAERTMVKACVHAIYGKFMNLRDWMREELFRDLLLRARTSQGLLIGVPEVLEIMSSIVHGFVLPVKKSHVEYLNKVIMPLHGMFSVIGFSGELKDCVKTYVEKDPNLVVVVLNGLMKYWNRYSSKAQLVLLQEMSEALELVKLNPRMRRKVFKTELVSFIAALVKDEHQLIAEEAVKIFTGRCLMKILDEEYAVLFHVVVSALYSSKRNHWSDKVREVSLEALSIIEGLNPRFFKRNINVVKKSTEKVKVIEEGRKNKWDAIRVAAAGK